MKDLRSLLQAVLILSRVRGGHCFLQQAVISFGGKSAHIFRAVGDEGRQFRGRQVGGKEKTPADDIIGSRRFFLREVFYILCLHADIDPEVLPHGREVFRQQRRNVFFICKAGQDREALPLRVSRFSEQVFGFCSVSFYTKGTRNILCAKGIRGTLCTKGVRCTLCTKGIRAPLCMKGASCIRCRYIGIAQDLLRNIGAVHGCGQRAAHKRILQCFFPAVEQDPQRVRNDRLFIEGRGVRRSGCRLRRARRS